MTINPNLRRIQARLILRARLEVAIARRAAALGRQLVGPGRDEGDGLAGGVGVAAAVGRRHILGVGRARVHAGAEVGREEREQRRVGRVFVAVAREFQGAEDWRCGGGVVSREGGGLVSGGVEGARAHGRRRCRVSCRRSQGRWSSRHR